MDSPHYTCVLRRTDQKNGAPDHSTHKYVLRDTIGSVEKNFGRITLADLDFEVPTSSNEIPYRKYSRFPIEPYRKNHKSEISVLESPYTVPAFNTVRVDHWDRPHPTWANVQW